MNFLNINNIIALFRNYKQKKKISKLLFKGKLAITTVNSTFKFHNLSNVKEQCFVFTDVQPDQYEIIISHKNKDLHKNRKLMWASFELSGAAVSEYIAKKLGLSIGKCGMFTYVGGGRTREGFYHSRSSIHIYKKTAFVIVKLHTNYKSNLEIKEIGLIGKNQQLNNVILNYNSDAFLINNRSIINKVSKVFNYNTYIVYANISPNVADGSSIWMSSIVDILATNHKVILLLKENLRNEIITSNIVNKDNVVIIQPSDYSNNTEINEQQALETIKRIDFIHPRLRGVLVRGIIAANELVSDRIFKYRTISYLTDFYEVNDGEVYISEVKKQLIKNIVLHSHLMLIQTEDIKEKLCSLLGYSHYNFAYLPPSLPDSMFKQSENVISVSRMEEIKIGYAGKIMPNWGGEELLSWVIEFNKNNKTKIKLFIAANKISAPNEQRKPFVSKILRLLEEANAEHYTTFNREQCINLLKKMDYVWAYRPAHFENATLELSTKLLEAIAMGQRVICYPSRIHVNELGDRYPFYAKDKESFYQMVLSNNLFDTTDLVNKFKVKHSISSVAERLSSYQPLNTENDTNNSKMICFAGHDFKFIDPYISYLKSKGFNVIRDIWEWGTALDLELSKESYSKSDIIFCEWGLANSVYFSKNNPDNKPLYIRVHLQEINDRARKFGKQINFDNVTKIIFVSENVRNEYIKQFGISREKTIVIPNFVLDDEYNDIKNKKSGRSPITLGMVGIVPQRKRFDRAVDLLIELNRKGVDTELHIKGHRPENLEFMKGASRIQELDYYHEVYNKIKENGLESKVIFSHWGNDVALWYKDIDFILSPSDFESFHYALADGVLSGSIPVVWNWSEAKSIYQDSWIVSSQEQAISYITKYIGKDNKKVIASNRDFIIKKYGKNLIFNALNKEVIGN